MVSLSMRTQGFAPQKSWGEGNPIVTPHHSCKQLPAKTRKSAIALAASSVHSIKSAFREDF